MELTELVNKGNYQMARGQYQVAIDTYNDALMIDPLSQTAKDNIVLCHNNWGIALFHQRKYEEAQAQWNAALKLNPLDRNAKQNLHVLKVTLDRLGVTGGAEGAAEGGVKGSPKRAAAKAPAAREDNGTPSANDATASGAVILNPGVKQSGAGEAAATSPETTSAASSTDEFAGTSIKILPSSSATPPPATPPPAAVQPAPTPTPSVSAPPPPTVQPVAGANMSPSTIEEQLAGVELKVYGHKQENMPIFQRLDKLEMDTSGAVKPGTVQQRIQTLRHSYGL